MGGRLHEAAQNNAVTRGQKWVAATGAAAGAAALFTFVDFAITMAYNPQVTRAAYRWLGMVMTF